MNLETAIAVMRKTNVVLPYKQQQAIENAILLKSNILQVWSCVSCGYVYKTETRIRACECPKKHPMAKTWDKNFVK
jgi:transposase-like protein